MIAGSLGRDSGLGMSRGIFLHSSRLRLIMRLVVAESHNSTSGCRLVCEHDGGSEIAQDGRSNCKQQFFSEKRR